MKTNKFGDYIFEPEVIISWFINEQYYNIVFNRWQVIEIKTFIKILLLKQKAYSHELQIIFLKVYECLITDLKFVMLKLLFIAIDYFIMLIISLYHFL